ncbi:MAG: MFS transporter [Candidatus Paceibacteria bacterium]
MNGLSKNHEGMRPRKLLSAFTTLLFLNLLVLFHHYSIAFVNSSFLGQFLSPEEVSAVFVAAALIVIVFLANAPRLIRTFRTLPLFIIIIPVLQLLVFFMGFAKTALAAVFFFVMQTALYYLLRYILDLYLESLSKDESRTGNTRGLFVTAGNLGVFLGPLVAALIIVGTFFAPLYAFSAALLLPVFLIALGPLQNIHPHQPSTVSFLDGLRQVWCCRPHIRRIMAAHLLFRIFGALVVIYVPLYLFESGAFSWQAIGGLLMFALIPFLILEIPLGFLADHFFGEKEILAIGLAIMGVSTAMLSFTPLSLSIVWGIWFILAQVGAAMAEIATESYFFKHVTEEDAPLISAFRSLTPLGGIITPALALVALLIVPLSSIFAIFGALFLVGIPFTLRILDTR